MIENDKNVFDGFEAYEKIRIALSGLKTILDVNFLEKDIYNKAGNDNIEAINDTILEMLKNYTSPRIVRMKMRELEIDPAVI